MTERRRYVIAGGGAGGVELAIRLARRRDGEVTLIDRRRSHLWKPRLHEVAAGLLVADDEAVGYDALAKRHGFAFVQGAVDAIDPAGQTITLAAGAWPDDLVAPAGAPQLSPARTLAYDVAILALGSGVDDFGVPGVDDHAYTLDTPAAAMRLHRAILAGAARVCAGEAERVEVVIAGAGTTGVELAAELRETARRLAGCGSLPDEGRLGIAIADKADRPLSGMDERMSDYACAMLKRQGVALRFGHAAARIAPGRVELDDGSILPADLAVWTTGICGALPALLPVGKADKAGRVAVDDRLRLMADGAASGSLYAIGDCSAAPLGDGADAGEVPATAQAAHQQAVYLADALTRHDPPPFRYRYKGTLVSLGAHRAAGTLPGPGGAAGGFDIHGLGARIAYLFLYRSHLALLFGWPRALALALSDRLRRVAAPSVKLDW